MSKINLSNLSNELKLEELKEIKGGKPPTCDCSWLNGFAKDYYQSTCGCSGMGSVFADMLT